MEKQLDEIDEYYRKAVKKTSKKVRIDYCYKVIDKAQFVLSNSGRYLTKSVKEELINKVEAAKIELQNLID